MTRTEAIGLLSGLMFKGKLKEALDMAIKALEQESSSSEKPNKSEIPTGSTAKNDLGVDLISRAKLLKAMNTFDKFGYTARYGLERLDKDDKGFVPYVHYVDMVKCVNGMPSITPQEPRIITCKDCKYYRNQGNKHSYCTKRLNVDSVIDRYREPNFYCADAVLREVKE
jgi:hypothetical protein